MYADDFQKERIVDHLKTGMAVGLWFLLLFGLLNAFAVMWTTAVWFQQFVQGGSIPAGAKDYLLEFMPIFSISAVSNGFLGILLGGIWGVLLGTYLKLRGRCSKSQEDRASLHIASFFAFPFIYITIFLIILLKYVFNKESVSLEVSHILLFLLVLTVFSYILFRIIKGILNLLFRISIFRFPITRKGFVTLTVSYGLLIGLASYIPPLLVSPVKGGALPFSCSIDSDKSAQLPDILLIVLDTTRADIHLPSGHWQGMHRSSPV